MRQYGQRKALQELPGFDCDNIAFFVVSCLRTLAPNAGVTFLVDSGPWSYAICVVEFGGTRWSLDTNGLKLLGDRPPLDLFGRVYPEERYVDCYEVDYPFGDPR